MLALKLAAKVQYYFKLNCIADAYLFIFTRNGCRKRDDRDHLKPFASRFV